MTKRSNTKRPARKNAQLIDKKTKKVTRKEYEIQSVTIPNAKGYKEN